MAPVPHRASAPVQLQEVMLRSGRLAGSGWRAEILGGRQRAEGREAQSRVPRAVGAPCLEVREATDGP